MGGLLLCFGLAEAASASELLSRVDRLRSLLEPAGSSVGRSAGAPRVKPGTGCQRPAPDAPRNSERLERAIRDASIRFGVAPGLIRAVVRVESAGDSGAVSHAGAMGLMQLMPATAKSLGVVCAFEPRQNVLGGTRYLRELRDRLGSWRRALAAYNAGPGRVLSGRIPEETRRYVELVMKHWQRGSEAYRSH
jgi:soluble lytic murein transglycosylase-like protein